MVGLECQLGWSWLGRAMGGRVRWGGLRQTGVDWFHGVVGCGAGCDREGVRSGWNGCVPLGRVRSGCSGQVRYRSMCNAVCA